MAHDKDFSERVQANADEMQRRIDLANMANQAPFDSDNPYAVLADRSKWGPREFIDEPTRAALKRRARKEKEKKMQAAISPVSPASPASPLRPQEAGSSDGGYSLLQQEEESPFSPSASARESKSPSSDSKKERDIESQVEVEDEAEGVGEEEVEAPPIHLGKTAGSSASDEKKAEAGHPLKTKQDIANEQARIARKAALLKDEIERRAQESKASGQPTTDFMSFKKFVEIEELANSEARKFFNYLKKVIPKEKWNDIKAAQAALAFKRYLEMEADLAYMLPGDKNLKQGCAARFYKYASYFSAFLGVTMEPFYWWYVGTDGVGAAISDWFGGTKQAWQDAIGLAAAAVNLAGDLTSVCPPKEAADFINPDYDKREKDKAAKEAQLKDKYANLKSRWTFINKIIAAPTFLNFSMAQAIAMGNMFGDTSTPTVAAMAALTGFSGVVYYFMFSSSQFPVHPDRVVEFFVNLCKNTEKARTEGGPDLPTYLEISSALEFLVQILGNTAYRTISASRIMAGLMEDLLKVDTSETKGVFTAMAIIGVMTAYVTLMTRSAKPYQKIFEFNPLLKYLKPEHMAEAAKILSERSWGEWLKDETWKALLAAFRSVPVWWMMSGANETAATIFALVIHGLQWHAMRYKQTKEVAVKTFEKELSEAKKKEDEAKNSGDEPVPPMNIEDIRRKYFMKLAEDRLTPGWKSAVTWVNRISRGIRLAGFQGFLKGTMDFLQKYNGDKPVIELSFWDRVALTSALGIPVSLADASTFQAAMEEAVSYYLALSKISAPDGWDNWPWKLLKPLAWYFTSYDQIPLDKIKEESIKHILFGAREGMQKAVKELYKKAGCPNNEQLLNDLVSDDPATVADARLRYHEHLASQGLAKKEDLEKMRSEDPEVAAAIVQGYDELDPKLKEDIVIRVNDHKEFKDGKRTPPPPQSSAESGSPKDEKAAKEMEPKRGKESKSKGKTPPAESSEPKVDEKATAEAREKQKKEILARGVAIGLRLAKQKEDLKAKKDARDARTLNILNNPLSQSSHGQKRNGGRGDAYGHQPSPDLEMASLDPRPPLVGLSGSRFPGSSTGSLPLPLSAAGSYGNAGGRARAGSSNGYGRFYRRAAPPGGVAPSVSTTTPADPSPPPSPLPANRSESGASVASSGSGVEPQPASGEQHSDDRGKNRSREVVL